MRILVTGAGGLLGGRLCVLLSPEHATTALVRAHSAPDGIEAFSADLVDAKAIGGILQRIRPEAVIHCAALADADLCELKPALARRENQEATGTLASACVKASARLITISTDLVFDGASAFENESSPPGPLMHYGRSKVGAEEATLKSSPAFVVLRVALLLGRGHGPRLSASESVARRLRRGEVVNLFEDEWRTPVDPGSVAEAVRAVLLRPHLGGRFHISGAERITRFDLGMRTASVFGLDPSLIRRARRNAHSGAPRPADVSLDSSRARLELGWSARPLDLAIREGRLG